MFSEPSNVFEVFLIDFCYSLESGCWFRGRRDQSNIVVVAAAAAAAAAAAVMVVVVVVAKWSSLSLLQALPGHLK